MGLHVKRAFLILFLLASIAYFSYYQYVYNINNPESITKLTVSRKQKEDYKNLFDNSNFKSFTIEFTEESFQELLSNMQAYFDQYGTYQDNTMSKVNIIYNDGLGESFTIYEVGFRTKSNTSRNLPLTYDWMNRATYHQTSFQIQFDATFDYSEYSNEYAVLNTREAFNVDQLNFEYCKSYDANYDEAMISEMYSYLLYDEAGIAVSKATNAIVYLKIGETIINYGFYTVIEPVDTEFLKKNFDSDLIGDYGDLYKATDTSGIADLSLNYDGLIGINENDLNERYSYALKNNTLDGTRTRHDTLIDFITDINNLTTFETHATDLLDVDSFARALAIDFLLGNTDDYRYNYNNYYLYFNVYTNQAVYIPFDLDNTLGFGKHQDVTYQYGLYYPLFSDTDQYAILVNSFFSVEEYKNLYLSYLDEFVNSFFNYDHFYLEYIQAKELYQDLLVNENHLGNQVFGLRNVAYYIVTKQQNVLNYLEDYTY